MRARLDLLICCAALAEIGCTRDNPAFEDEGAETEAQATVAEGTDELPSETGTSEDPPACALTPGTDMIIKVPQPCGETDDALGLYQHWFHVVEAGGSTWSVQFCNEGCLECEPVAANLELSPLPVAELAGPGACLQLAARRLGTGDDCNYHTVTIIEPSVGGRVVVVARRTELLEVPLLGSNTGLMGFDPGLVVDDTCDCASAPDSCCDGQAPTVYAYDVGGTQIPVGSNQTVVLGGRNYEFWAFDAYHSGECQAPTQISWALTAAQ